MGKRHPRPPRRNNKNARGGGHGFQVFGAHPVEQAIANLNKDTLRSSALTLGTQARLDRIADLARGERIPTRRMDPRDFDEAHPDDNHQCVVLRLPRFPYQSLEEILERVADKPNALLVALDQVQDPHNLGAIARSAAAFGADGLILVKDQAAGVTPTAVKTSAGALFSLPVARVTNLSRTMVALKDAFFWLYGAAGEAEADSVQTEWPERVTLIMGAEGRGLRRLTRDKCDALVRVPQTSGVESLNVSVAAGVLLYSIQATRLSVPPKINTHPAEQSESQDVEAGD